MAKQKLNIEPKGFPTNMSEPYKSLKGVGNMFINIPLELLDEVDEQPFPINNDKVEQIADSIENVGVIEPLIVVKDGERYKILSGRHRFRACKKLGKKEIPCYIKNVSEDVARYILIATNTDRNNEYPPTVYAKAYAEQVEFMKKLGKKTVSAIADQNGLSRKQIYRYIRITYLTEDWQKWVDRGIIGMLVAVELSFLSETKQTALYKHLIGTGIAENAISRNIMTVDTAKMIHSVADTISDEEFAENIEKIIFGHYNKNQPVEEVVEPISETETAETVEETPMPKEEKIKKPKDKTVPEKKSAVEEVSEDTEIEETSVAEVSEDTAVEEDTEIEETEVEEIPETDNSDNDFEKIIKGYMLVALHDYGMDCDKETIDELYQRINSSTALDLYNKICQL